MGAKTQLKVIPPDLLTCKQVCAILQISRPTLSRYVKSGRIPAFKIGPMLRFSEAEIFRAMERTQPSNTRRET